MLGEYLGGLASGLTPAEIQTERSPGLHMILLRVTGSHEALFNKSKDQVL